MFTLSSSFKFPIPHSQTQKGEEVKLLNDEIIDLKNNWYNSIN